MGLYKTDNDIKLDNEARRIGDELFNRGLATGDRKLARLLTSMNVIGGGRKGPYTLSISRLSRKSLMRVIEAVVASEGKPEVATEEERTRSRTMGARRAKLPLRTYDKLREIVEDAKGVDWIDILGPYTLVVHRLSRERLLRVIEAVAAIETEAEVSDETWDRVSSLGRQGNIRLLRMGH